MLACVRALVVWLRLCNGCGRRALCTRAFVRDVCALMQKCELYRSTKNMYAVYDRHYTHFLCDHLFPYGRSMYYVEQCFVLCIFNVRAPASPPWAIVRTGQSQANRTAQSVHINNYSLTRSSGCASVNSCRRTIAANQLNRTYTIYIYKNTLTNTH